MSDLIERMRGFEQDHEPDGWPAVQMRDVSALCELAGQAPEMSRVARRKIEQMGGKPCGLIVQNEAGALAAVSEHGRVTWLDDVVMGPASSSEIPSNSDEQYPNCDTCGCAMDYMPWHYASKTERHLHSCNSCWPKVNPALALGDAAPEREWNSGAGQ